MNPGTATAAGTCDQQKLLQFIEAVPKAELHLHIEGTLEPELLFSLAKRNNVDIPYTSVEEITQAYKFDSLQSFLDLYYQGMSVLLHASDFSELAYAYTRRMHENNIRHAEPFFDPQGHLSRGVAFRTVYEGLMDGFRRGEAEFGVSVSLIFSFLRHITEAECLALVQANAADEQSRYIAQLFAEGAFVAVGLDSSEKGNPPENFQRLYQYCRDVLKVPFVVAHAGEEGPPEYIWSALRTLRVDRVDHGVACRSDAALRAQLRQSQMPLTICPLSNVHLKVFGSEKECAEVVMSLFREGLRVTINSDDPAYFGGYVNNSYKMLMESGQLTQQDVLQLAKNSIESSFLSAEKKRALLAQVDASYEEHFPSA